MLQITSTHEQITKKRTQVKMPLMKIRPLKNSGRKINARGAKKPSRKRVIRVLVSVMATHFPMGIPLL